MNTLPITLIIEIFIFVLALGLGTGICIGYIVFNRKINVHSNEVVREVINPRRYFTEATGSGFLALELKKEISSDIKQSQSHD